MDIRLADVEKDLKQLKLLWCDAAWDMASEDYEAELRLLPACKTLVADDSDEGGQGIGAAVIVMESEFQFLDSSLPLSAVIAVLTASSARRRGYSSRTLATMLEQERARGAAVAILGAFDAGYYDRLGFGSGGYDPLLIVDPAALRIPEAAQRALDEPGVRLRRITVDDAAALYAGHLRRPRTHGACTAGKDGYIRAAVASTAKKGFGLAICDRKQGEEHIRAHFFGIRLKEEQLDIMSICADTPHDYLQILEVIHRLSDQLEQVKIPIPSSIHVHDLLARPLRDGLIHTAHPFDTLMLWQLRILDLPRAVEAVQLPIAEPLHFRLQIDDPIATASPSGWSGCAGNYEVLLGPRSRCTPFVSATETAGLPLLDASIGAFSRFWAGAVRPTTLCNSDHFHAPPALIAALERRYVVPVPQREWTF